jgi:PAS domain S-box-containing protein
LQELSYMETIEDLKNKIAELTAENEHLKAKSLEAYISDKAFRESEGRFKAVFEASRLGNKIIGPDLLILQVNAALVELLGYSSKDEIIGTAILDYSPTDQHKDWSRLQEQLWRHSMPSFSLQTTLIKKDGSFITCQVTSILFEDNGQTLGYTIIEDITEQERLRQQKEEFISVASHELKTPVTSLKATLQLMNRILSKEGNTSDRLRQFAQGAEKSAAKLSYLINDLLNSTGIKNGQLNLNRIIFPVKELLASCCDTFTVDGIYQINIQGDVDTMVYADYHKIEQVIVNLVNNAIKYAPNSHLIAIRVDNLSTLVRITVSDNGPGIAPEHLDKIFERYYRADEKKSHTSGLGLGLYISSEILRRHNGTMGVESKLGEGSSFYFTLPVQDGSVV